ncbi:5-formyltetrahydrofolate cyclo-ligase [Paenibacillus glacialis]|uniref:5-formyltetrahydrofolate cyclo-ligase n=1 Tax=Paenibacillus glacialis TaxID=494026 RepID=A0A168NZC0_9BACL|nr:5-formyltetrahydrofolate cyclo-ligase [Paenibacillus glacialis]OAB46244.1 hypothetical protein PGLA_02360 [Paenibacillus glacialis]
MGMNGNNDPLSDTKKKLRFNMNDERNSLSNIQREQWSNEAIYHMMQVLESMKISNFLVYISFRSELNTRPLIEWGWSKGLQVLVPRCNPKDYSMDIYSLRDWDELSSGSYGIEEPNPLRTSAFGHQCVPDVIIVPGLAFDRMGGRLGYGRGYYDRLYERLQPYVDHRRAPILIGLGYEMQVVNKVPMGRHDAMLDILVTEKAIVNCDKEGNDGINSFQ